MNKPDAQFSIDDEAQKARRRSKLWQVESQIDRSEMKSMIGIVMEQSLGNSVDAETLPVAEEELEVEYKNTMY